MLLTSTILCHKDTTQVSLWHKGCLDAPKECTIIGASWHKDTDSEWRLWVPWVVSGVSNIWTSDFISDLEWTSLLDSLVWLHPSSSCSGFVTDQVPYYSRPVLVNIDWSLIYHNYPAYNIDFNKLHKLPAGGPVGILYRRSVKRLLIEIISGTYFTSRWGLTSVITVLSSPCVIL